MVSIFNEISISQTAGWPSNRKVKKWTNTILNKACSAATAEAEAKVYEREESETKNIIEITSWMNYSKTEVSVLQTMGKVFLEFKKQMLENM